MPPARGHHHMAVRGLSLGANYSVVRTQSEARYTAQRLKERLRASGYDVRGSTWSGEFSASASGRQAIRCEWWRCDDEDCREWREAQAKGAR